MAGLSVSPVNASLLTSRWATHDSGARRFATPFLYWTFTNYHLPVCAGALPYWSLIQNKLHHALPQISKEQGKFGICIGDVNPTNFHIDEEILTVFDFDQCGYGYRAFEIGKFISAIHTLKNTNEIANAFLSGYQKVRPLSQDELSAIPYFEVVSVIWVMSINANNADLIGHKWLEQPFWDRKITILKELDNALHFK